MTRAYASGVVAAPAEQVWRAVRLFDGIPDILPSVPKSEIIEGGEGQVGSVRRLTTEDGDVVSEKLLALDDRGRSYTYGFVSDNPFGCRNYISTIRVAPVTTSGHCFVEWYSDFDTREGDEGRLTALFGDGVYASGIAQLQERFG
ncbi:SRPBCC family protein [Actinomycetospora sp. OC33-EN08]|uniref:SRPBCC family protein n=1 Tax=Actinomycetospora aurantiaca TaxID=3129233 RepID=A0ABU8MU93_9PSEU